jgi:hypothetical protein
MSIELKIKVKSLAEEARIIRKEERKLHGMRKWGLQHHRTTVVRDAARRSLVAYQFVRGRDWKSCASRDVHVHQRDRSSIEKMIQKYGTRRQLEEWKNVKEESICGVAA